MHCLWYRRKNLRASFQKKNCRHSIYMYLHHQFTRLYSSRENSPTSSKPLCNSNDNSSDISSVSPIKPSPVKVPSKTTESFQCNTNDDGDVCTLAPVKSSLSKEKCPVVSEQTSSTTKSLPSSNPIGSPKSSDFQHKSRHATTIKNKNYAAQRLHQRITSAKQKQNETNEPAEGEIIEVETYKLLDGRRNKRTVWVKNCLYQLACDERDIFMSGLQII